MVLEKRREIIFLYDVIRANPNGDPDDGNRPRMDDEGYNLVTDVRLKRTIRDYWLSKTNPNIKVLIRQQLKDDKKTVMSMHDIIEKELEEQGEEGESGATRAKLLDHLPKKYLDVRTFGAAVTFKTANVSITGPVQFGIGKSLNKPNIETMTITSVLSAKGEQGAGTMGQFHYVDYSLILFHGIACEYNSKETGFSEEDLKLVYEGLWNGTKRLNTRSKFNHTPRLIISVVSKENEFQIGGLDTKIHLEQETNIKSPEEAKIVLDDFVSVIKDFKDSVAKIEYKESGDLVFCYNGNEHNSITEILKEIGVPLEEIQI